MRYRIDEAMIAHKEVDGEVIAIDFVSGAYFSMQGTACEIWQLLASGAEDQAIISLFEPLAERATVRAEIERFIEELLAARLVEADPGAVAAPTATTVAPRSFGRPVLEKFDDMAEMIMLDPVHDVSDAGWPYRPDQAV